MNYQGAIFDMDGVLFDTERVFQDTWQEIAAEYHVVLAENFMRVIAGTTGRRMCEIIEQFYHVSDGSVIMEECMKRVRGKLKQEVPVKPGVYEILRLLKERGIKTAVASSSTREQILSNLRLTQTEEFFDAVVSGTQVACGKPAPDIFLLAAREIGCSPQECYVFEDSENGVRAGCASGARTIMIPDLVEPCEEIRGICDEVCRDFFEVIHRVIEKQRNLW